MTLINELENISSELIHNSPLNYIQDLNSLKIFEPPLFAVASSQDPIFELLKEESIVGPHHLMPQEWLQEANAVISYFLPFSFKLRESNHKMGMPSLEWLYGRIEGESLNRALRNLLTDFLLKNGLKAMSPGLDSRLTLVNKKCNWSERHAAYIAGLGTFSLNGSLITVKGSAGRLGSVITNAELEITKRPYSKKDEYCNHCGACVFRCPPMAITEEGKDHSVCSDYLDRVKLRFNPRYGCGKCQTSVPCEDKIPQPISRSPLA